MPRLTGLLGVVLLCFAFACTRRSPAPAATVAAEAATSEVDANDGAAPEGRDLDATPDLRDAGRRDAGADGGTEAGTAATEEKPSPSRAAAPPVKVVTIGMHVGGGPFDEATKQPMRRSVEPRFAELAQCWTHVTEPARTDVGVDLLIESAGGRARVSNPRTTMKNEAFVSCVVQFFESVDFEKPLHGRTVVSYSVRFTP
jgi:hypothetical protein